MRNVMLSVLALALLFVGSASAAGVDESAIQELLAQRSAVFNAQEYEKLIPLFATDKQASRAANISKQKDTWKSKGLVVSNQLIESLEISGAKATAVYKYDLSGSKKSEKISFVKESDGWKILDIAQ